MSIKYKEGDYLRDQGSGKKMLKNKLPEGEMLVSEGPRGGRLWRDTEELNEEEKTSRVLNE